jgi:hypothetical protein
LNGSDKSLTVCKFNEFTDEPVKVSEFKPSDFFPGAFTYHVHFGKLAINNESLFASFERFYLNNLKLN